MVRSFGTAIQNRIPCGIFTSCACAAYCLHCGQTRVLRTLRQVLRGDAMLAHSENSKGSAYSVRQSRNFGPYKTK